MGRRFSAPFTVIFTPLDVCSPTPINNGDHFVFHSDKSHTLEFGVSRGRAGLQTCNTDTDAQTRAQIAFSPMTTLHLVIFPFLFLPIRALDFDFCRIIHFYTVNTIVVHIPPVGRVLRLTSVSVRQL
jgi:hypothetical protein